MRIAQVVSLHESVPPKSRNGLEFVVSWLTEELIRRGHEVTLFAPADSETKAKLISLLPKGVKNDHKVYWESYYFSIWNTIIAASQSKKFDIIHCHNSNAPYIAASLDTPVIQTLHSPVESDLYTYYLQHPEYAPFLKPILDAYKKVHYVTVSKRQQELWNIYEPYYFKKKRTIYNGIPVDAFTFNKNPSDYLLYIGYINKNKGADVAVRVAQKLKMKLILAGNAFGEEDFFETEIKPHLNDKITYIGPVDFATKNGLYKNAIATLAPLQWEEPFGLTLVESQACGTPVIAFNKGAAAELIKEGVTGYIVKNEDEMCRAVKQLASIKREDCRAWVEKNFDVSGMVTEYENLYKKLAIKRRS